MQVKNVVEIGPLSYTLIYMDTQRPWPWPAIPVADDNGERLATYFHQVTGRGHGQGRPQAQHQVAVLRVFERTIQDGRLQVVTEVDDAVLEVTTATLGKTT